MAAVKEMAIGIGEAGFKLVELLNGGINFVLLGDGSNGYCWYLPNPDGPEEQEDWVFHALRKGRASSFVEAVDDLCKSAQALWPESDYAKVSTR